MPATTTLNKSQTKPKDVLVWLRRQSAIFLIATIMLAIHIFVAVTGPWWAPYPPTKMRVGDTFGPPSTQHWFGTDNFGRDVFSRIVYGERIVLTLALSTSALSVVIGSILGIALAYARGWVDEGGMRLVEILMTVPPLILALLILGALGSSFPLMVAVVAFFFIPRVITVIRAAALGVVTEDFVTAARLRGESAWFITIHELMPNVMSSVSVEFSLRTAFAVLFIGGLSFLGFGAAPPTPEWGLMINEGRSYITAAPWMVIAPSLALATLVVALSLFTEGISEMLGLSAQRERTG